MKDIDKNRVSNRQPARRCQLFFLGLFRLEFLQFKDEVQSLGFQGLFDETDIACEPVGCIGDFAGLFELNGDADGLEFACRHLNGFLGSLAGVRRFGLAGLEGAIPFHARFDREFQQQEWRIGDELIHAIT